MAAQDEKTPADTQPAEQRLPESATVGDPRVDADIEATQIGTDEWVAQVETRRRGRTGAWGHFLDRWEELPATWRYGFILAIFILLPLATGSQFFLDLIGISDDAFILRTLARFLVFGMLAIGLNVVVGYAGLLDLGYVAFFGVAGYLYAYMSSEFIQIEGFIPNGLAVPSLLSVPLIIALTAAVGWFLGSISIRLTGDYLAIVTLGFGQVFVQLALTATRVNLPFRDRPVDLTRGPNGINELDDISLFGFTFDETIEYYYLFLVLLIIVYVTIYHINQSRIGRAWRAIREDELAAEVMGTPTRRLKLLAFAIGAGIAALAGSVDAAWQGNVVPVPRYSVLTLINLYAMVVLGGTGSLPGVVLGAFIFTVLPEILRSVTLASVLFYGLGLVGLYAYLRPLKRFAVVFGGTLVTGVVFRLFVNLLFPTWDSGFIGTESILNQIVQGWIIIPENYQLVGNIVTGAAVFVLLVTILVRQERPRLHYVLLGLTTYLFAFSWETRLAVEPSATRILFVGVSLVALMIFRPQGLLGQAEVKVV